MHIVRFIAFMQLFIVKLKERHRSRPHTSQRKHLRTFTHPLCQDNSWLMLFNPTKCEMMKREEYHSWLL